jgi:hypothetical protein
LSIALLYLWFVLHRRGAALALPLFLVFLADLVTLPLVCYFFPMLKTFTPIESRYLGLFWSGWLVNPNQPKKPSSHLLDAVER